MIPQVVASERGIAQTVDVSASSGLKDHNKGKRLTKWNGLEKPAVEGESPVHDLSKKPSDILSSAEHEEFCVNQRGPSRKAKYSRETDSEPVP